MTTEYTTLLLRHVAGTRYVVDEVSSAGRAIYDELQPKVSWQLGDLKAALVGLDWQLEDDQDEGALRRLFLKRG